VTKPRDRRIVVDKVSRVITVTIAQFMQKLPRWVNNSTATLPYQEDNYQSFVDIVEGFISRNSTNRALFAQFPNTQTTPAASKPAYSKPAYTTEKPASTKPWSKPAETQTSLNPAAKPYLGNGTWRNSTYANNALPKEQQDRRDALYADRKCFKCEQTGHLSKNCPQGANALKAIALAEPENTFKIIENAGDSDSSSSNSFDSDDSENS